MTLPTIEQVDQYQDLIDDLIIESDETYHSQRDENNTSSSVKDFIHNPKLYYLKHIKKELTQDETLALYIGTLTHVVVLEGPRKAMSDYSMLAPINKDGGEYGFVSKKFKEAQAKTLEEQNKRLCRREDYAVALEMRMAVMQHLIAMDLLAIGQAERVVRGVWLGMPVQIKMDYITPYGILDLKTSYDIERFYNGSDYCDVHKYGYLYSAAFYRAILHHFRPDIPKQDFYFIVVNKKPPHTVGVWKVAPDVLDHYEEKIIEAMSKLKEAKEFDDWPDPYQKLRTIEL